MEIANDVLSILSSSAIEGRFLTLPGQLDRKLYERTDKVLRAAGGLWIRGQKAHMFPEDASERIEQIILTGSVVVPRDEFDYFPTPPAVVAAVVLAADCSAGMTVLEPSAGKGHIARAFMDYAVVDCVEVLEQHYEVLSDMVGERGIQCVSHNDFLAIEPEAFYDRVVMNPPFSKRADIHHVTHAWKFVRPGGRLVAVMPPSFMYRTDKLTRAFNDMRNAAKSMLVEGLPEHSFKSSGTLVSTVLLTMDKVLLTTGAIMTSDTEIYRNPSRTSSPPLEEQQAAVRANFDPATSVTFEDGFNGRKTVIDLSSAALTTKALAEESAIRDKLMEMGWMPAARVHSIAARNTHLRACLADAVEHVNRHNSDEHYVTSDERMNIWRAAIHIPRESEALAQLEKSLTEAYASGRADQAEADRRDLSDDEVESLAVGAGMEGHRTYMSPPDFHHWCDTMRAFLVAARAAA